MEIKVNEQNVLFAMSEQGTKLNSENLEAHHWDEIGIKKKKGINDITAVLWRCMNSESLRYRL